MMMEKINKKIIKYFGMLSDETRLRILLTIARGPATVNEIHENMNGLTLSAVSHQLNAMANLNIVNSEKNGREKYYSLSDEYCWCPLRDVFSNIGNKTACPHCAEIRKKGGSLI
jgi:DNA-binding transcriptional ArsR family regulator